MKSSGQEELFRDVIARIEGIENVFMKEFSSSEDESTQIKLIIAGKPDMAILNDTINDLIEKIDDALAPLGSGYTITTKPR